MYDCDDAAIGLRRLHASFEPTSPVESAEADPRAGYWGQRQMGKRLGIKQRRCHGFDELKFNAASLFYLPCQAKDSGDSFFIDYGENDPKRGPLDLRAWIEGCIFDLRPVAEPMPTAPSASVAPPTAAETARVRASFQAITDKLMSEKTETQAGRRDAQVEAAVAAWQADAYLPGHIHSAFFRLGAALKRAGLDESEIRAKLCEQAVYARSPRERRGEITGILKSLRRFGSLKGGAR
jgi:hypothetical protein